MRDDHYDRVEVAGEIVDETERAFLFFDGTRHEWFPKGQVEWDPDEKVLRLPKWLAKARGMI